MPVVRSPVLAKSLVNSLFFAIVLRWSGPYLTRMIKSVKAVHPAVPLTIYANGSGGLLERLKATGADVVRGCKARWSL